MFLIYGLGNNDTKYKHTRHNVGFLTINYLCGKFGIDVDEQLCGLLFNDDQTITPIKARGFINNSGKYLKQIIDEHNISTDDIIVIHDDVLWDLGEIKFFDSIKNTGHNGLKDIIITLQTNDFKRVAIGIKDSQTELPMDEFVLSHLAFNELNLLVEVYEKAYRLIKPILIERKLFKKEG